MLFNDSNNPLCSEKERPAGRSFYLPEKNSSN